MKSKDNLVIKCVAGSSTTLKSNRRLKNLLRSLRKTSSEQLEKQPCIRDDLKFTAQDHEPFVFGQRVVLRHRGVIPIKILIATHKLFKEVQMRANRKFNQVNAVLGFSKDSDEEILRRVSFRTFCEEQLKTSAQLIDIYPRDPGVTLRTQELFDQFYKAHDKPNDAEKDLLALVGHVNETVVDQWFEAKKFRLRAVAKMREATLRTLLQMDASYPARYQARELERNKPKRSVHLH